MQTLMRNKKWPTLFLIILFAVYLCGCTTFVPLQESSDTGGARKAESRIRVRTYDGALYIFPPQQCTIYLTAQAKPSLVKGWGDKYGAYGLIDKGLFELSGQYIESIEIETLKTGNVLLLAGAIVGASALSYFAIRAISADGGTSGGKGILGPDTGN